MLVLSRKTNEQIVIQVGAQTIRVCVVDATRDRVRLGFIAAAEVTIHREEVVQRMQLMESEPAELASAG